ncbi:hypothetical protein AMATHDRAFT_158745 [Amanita thiersii Skay4041]|uniref:J domain-containing protein n=1 Tax=Amanita thiersii Skay4041 TaxID=703135 RepID=A0A2A9N6E6_9AGAR|nr:hypothetical protein AMATHDRAFT_158745 [Amanita thiersii Skay4041]
MHRLGLSRFAALPVHLQLFIQCRLASSSVNGGHGHQQFPFPTHPRPTPHQIFHLPYNASQPDIKARYIDLVRIYHPDSPHCRSVPPSERRNRFQLITAAYDMLRGKTQFGAAGNRGGPFDPYEAELHRRKRAYYAHLNRRPGYHHYPFAEHKQSMRGAWVPDQKNAWKDRLIIVFGLLCLIGGIVPSFLALPQRMEKAHKAAAANLKQARDEAREFGGERMAYVRRRVRESKAQEEEPLSEERKSSER